MRPLGVRSAQGLFQTGRLLKREDLGWDVETVLHFITNTWATWATRGGWILEVVVEWQQRRNVPIYEGRIVEFCDGSYLSGIVPLCVCSVPYCDTQRARTAPDPLFGSTASG
jgi:hypothetical protein